MLEELFKTGLRLGLSFFILIFSCTPGAKLRTFLNSVQNHNYTSDENLNKTINYLPNEKNASGHDKKKYHHSSSETKNRIKLDNYGTSSPRAYSRKSADLEYPVLSKDDGSIKIKDFYLSAEPEKYRLTILLNRLPEFKANVLKKPDRLYIDLNNTSLDPDKKLVQINDGFIKSIRTGQFNKSTARLVLDLTSAVRFDIKQNKNLNQLYVDFSFLNQNNPFSNRQNFYAAKTSSQKLSSNRSATIAAPHTESTLAQELGLKVNTIIIDPGHGGKDPGAVSPSGIKEKDVTLNIAKQLCNFLKQNKNVNVHLTRESDVYVPLEERTEFANRMNGDLFISIHVNAHQLSDRNGIETYYLSLAKDEEARRVAAFENTTANISFSQLENTITGILKNSKIEESQEFADLIQYNLIQETNQNNRGVRQAGFVVLIGAQMPAILVEIGFLTNPKEQKLLTNNHYCQMVAEALYRGIENYSEKLLVASR